MILEARIKFYLVDEGFGFAEPVLPEGMLIFSCTGCRRLLIDTANLELALHQNCHNRRSAPVPPNYQSVRKTDIKIGSHTIQAPEDARVVYEGDVVQVSIAMGLHGLYSLKTTEVKNVGGHQKMLVGKPTSTTSETNTGGE